MKVIMRSSRLLALVIALAAGAFVLNLTLPASTSETQATNHELRPDLITVQPFDISIVSVRKGKSTERRLRLSNRIANIGEGPLEMYPVSEDCDGDGDVRNDRLVKQRIFGDTNGVAGFQRGDTVLYEHEVGCMIFHAQHRHWHLQNFAEYELWGVDAWGQPTGAEPVAASTKVSFCVIDTDNYGSSEDPYYTSCGRSATLGLSVGWSDVYGYWLAGQYIVINGLADGTYCLLSTADPGDDPSDPNDGGILESNEVNNAAGVLVTLTGNSVSTTGAPCS